MKKNLSIKWLVVKNGIEKFLIKNFEIFVPSSAGNFREIGYHTQVGINKNFSNIVRAYLFFKKKKKIMSVEKFSKKEVKEKY